MTVSRLLSSGVTLRVSCETRCQVRARLTAVGGGGLPSGTTLARTSQRLLGRRVAVRLRLGRRDVARLTACGCLPRVRVSTTVTRRGRTVRRSQTIRLIAAKPPTSTGPAPQVVPPAALPPAAVPPAAVPPAAVPPAAVPPVVGPSVVGPRACSSTPQRLVFSDPRGDDTGTGDNQQTKLAPDVIGVELVTDGSCNLSVGLQLAGSAASGDLTFRQFAAIYLDVDGNPATGDASGGDVLVGTVGEFGSDGRFLGPFLKDQNAYANLPAPGEPFLAAGIRTSFASLGITQPVNLGIRVLTLWEDPDVIAVDFAPDKPGTGVFQESFRAPISFVPAG